MDASFWIYFHDTSSDGAGRWYPAVSLRFTSLESAQRVIDALQAEFPGAEFRIETDGGVR